MRLHLFEFEDLSWFPNIIREGMVDYLKFLLGNLNFYKPTTPLIAQVLERSGQNEILDLCSGGGGAIIQVHKNLTALTNKNFKISLSDKFPNVTAFRHIEKITDGKIRFIEKAIDATKVLKEITGLRTMFTAFHHFKATDAKAILKNAVDSGKPIAIFDVGDKNLLSILGIILFNPIIILLCSPFFKPFKISRLFFTYVIPLIPICTVWDGFVSILRLYEPVDLKQMIEEINSDKYIWEIGKVKHRLGFRVTYLVGYAKAS